MPLRAAQHAASCTRTGRFWPPNRVLAQKGGFFGAPQKTSPAKDQVAIFGRMPKGADPCQNAVSWPKSGHFRARAAPRRMLRRATQCDTDSPPHAPPPHAAPPHAAAHHAMPRRNWHAAQNAASTGSLTRTRSWPRSSSVSFASSGAWVPSSMRNLSVTSSANPVSSTFAPQSAAMRVNCS